MRGYLSSRKLSNVKGRINYITNENKQEKIVDYYNTTNNEFWKMLASESKVRHKEVNAGGKCCEARELIIGIPQNSNITAQQICDTFKHKYGVECTCAIHQNNKNGIINKHCHLIFSERIKLEQPEIEEERRATRTYYYDSKGNKCRKADAIKVVKKGDVIKKGKIRYFTDKNEFFKSQKFVYDCKELFLKNTLKLEWSFESEKRDKELSEKHIGRNNPNEKYIKDNNRLKAKVKNICNASDFILEQAKGSNIKELKEKYNIKSFSAANYEENSDKVYDFLIERRAMYKTKVKSEINTHNIMNEDVHFLQSEDCHLEPFQEKIISDYEVKTKTRNKSQVIEFLKENLTKMVERIQKLVNIQDLLYIAPADRLEIMQDRRNDKLYIRNSAYEREQKEKDLEYDEPGL